MSALKLSQVKPFPSFNELAWETYLPVSKALKETSKITPANPLLVKPLNVLGKVKTGGEEKSLLKALLSTIRLYPAVYRGRVSSRSTQACHLIARQLGDKYDPDSKKFVRSKFLQNDYLGVLAVEESLNYTLIAFDEDWVLAGINDYINHEASYEMGQTQALRERLANLKPVISAGEVMFRWENKPVLTGTKIPKESLHIYAFNEPSLVQRQGFPRAKERNVQSKVYLIFAQVDEEEAEKIFTYLYRNVQLYSFFDYLVIRDLDLSSVRDFEYLFPVEYTFMGNYIIFKSDKMSQEDLERAFRRNEVLFRFPRVEDLLGCYAAYLLAEATYYQFGLFWEDRTLTIQGGGYIQGQDLQAHFLRILNEIRQEGVKFQRLPNFATAVKLTQEYGAKCFYYLGNYYIALHDLIEPVKYEDAPMDSREIEAYDPLRATYSRNLRLDALRYLGYLGYNTKEEPFFVNLKVGYYTYKVGLDIYTIYFYKATHGRELQIHEIEGKNDPEMKAKLEKLLRQGWFFDQKTKNIIQGYPGFIPGYPPIKRNPESRV